MESEGGCSRSKNSVGGCASENTGSSYASLDSKCRDDRDGVAPKCHCGGYAILYRSRTRKNPNRLFLGCPFFKASMVQTLTDKIRNVNRLIVVAGIVAMLVAVYVIGS
ncbi:hypothetical protein PIB30_020256 [Stylosanthes scabra]|uniref:Zinc finger GRF-type domain-containing protein n=1 Tax=Stylosanthes scabra TaxID=79078 RepID=A0ABU6U9J0_9FABA|nr:hypothetical protein [Stylosanthes scabra]